MVQCQLKLRMCKVQEQTCEQWLIHLASIYNWAVRKIELNAKNKIYFSKTEFHNLLAGHGDKLGIPSHTIQGTLRVVHESWSRCFKKLSGKPKLKSRRNRLTTILFPDPIAPPKGNRINLGRLGSVRFHKMDIPEGKIKCGRVVKRASGWYLCLLVDAEPRKIERTGYGEIGIDPGFKNLLTTSDGEIIEHPREYEAAEERLGQAQRGNDKHLVARIHERISNRRKDRNHKISRRLVAENVKIFFSKDPHGKIAKLFGKSVSSSAHAQLRRMLSYKSPKSGTEYAEVDCRFSTKTCGSCGSQSGPTGSAGLSVREWVCSDCGVAHDRDVNAAINALIAGAGLAHEGYAQA